MHVLGDGSRLRVTWFPNRTVKNSSEFINEASEKPHFYSWVTTAPMRKSLHYSAIPQMAEINIYDT
jgi:hypothetical protein